MYEKGTFRDMVSACRAKAMIDCYIEYGDQKCITSCLDDILQLVENSPDAGMLDRARKIISNSCLYTVEGG